MNTFREKVVGVIDKIKSSKKFRLLIIILLVAAVPLTVFIAQQVQDIRQQANTNQAAITVTPNTITAGGNVTVNWTIAQPTTAATPTTVPTNTPIPTNTPVPPTPTPIPPTMTPVPIACQPAPNITRNDTLIPGGVRITRTAGTNSNTPTNKLYDIYFTNFTNVRVDINGRSYTSPSSQVNINLRTSGLDCNGGVCRDLGPQGVSSVTFDLYPINPALPATMNYTIIDDCASVRQWTDFSGGGAGSFGAGSPPPLINTNESGPGGWRRGYNFFSPLIKKAYAQTALTGAETYQLFLSQPEGGDRIITPTPIGNKHYLNCAVSTTTPPTSPVYTSSCSYTIPPSTIPGSYFFRMFATDGTTVIGESNVLTVTAATDNAALKSGLISYWSMNNDDACLGCIGGGKPNTVIDSLGKNNAQGNEATWVTGGKIGNAHEFGSGKYPKEYIEIPNSTSLAPENFTVSAWVYPNDANSLSRGDNASIFNRRNSTSNELGMDFEIEGDATSPAGTMHCDVSAKKTDGSIGGNRVRNTAGTLVQPGQWNHVACVYNGATIKMFINGVMAGSVPLTGAMNNPASPLTQIGRNIYATNIFKGKIDEVGYWNRGLSDAEITQLATGISLYPPTPVNEDTTFSTSLYLTGIGAPSGTFSPKHPERPAVITLFDTNNTLITTRTGQITYTATSGNFIGTINSGQSTIPAGNYTVKVQTPQFLRKQYPGIFSLQAPGTFSLPTLYMTTGDVNLDNKIDILDYNLITTCYGNKQSSASCTQTPQYPDNSAPLADLNDDGVVEGIDYNLFIRSLATKEGD